MTKRPEPYIHRDPGDVIRSGDWNELQIKTREEVHTHSHSGGDDGLKIPRSGIEANAIDGTKIDPQAKAKMDSLNLAGSLQVGAMGSGREVVVNAEGNVGIGTSTPTEKLTVDGAISGFGIVPVGTILAWHKSLPSTPSLPKGWMECNGQKVDDSQSPYNTQTLPNLNDEAKFIRGGQQSGVSQKQDWKTFSVAGHASGLYTHSWVEIPKQGHNTTYPFGGKWESTVVNGQNLGNQLIFKFDETSEVRPTNVSMVWIIRIK